MINIEDLDNELYINTYVLHNNVAKTIWNKIKSDPNILREAVKITKDKWNKDILKGLAIADAMLIDYQNVDEIAYKELINTIYTNTNIARIVVDGASNGGYSFLLMSLWNYDLKLTKEQKAFAVNEAMNKIGTTKYKKQCGKYSKELKKHGITNEITTTIDIDGSINPIGAQTKNEYFYHMFTIMSETQAHGIGAYDIRYYILRNPNWTIEEKKKLIMDFWYDDETYDECLDEWEWGIINDSENYKEESLPPFDKYGLLNVCTYEMLLEYYGNKEITDKIWAEIEFCKQMHELRPQQWELELPKKMLLENKN